MSCEACVIDSTNAGCVEPTVRQEHSNLWIKNVEDALHLHPAVLECIVTDVPDSTCNGKIVAFVALQAELTGREQELRDWVRYTVGECKIPDRIVILPELPKESPGTVDRSALEDLILSFETGLDVVAS